MRSVSDAPPRSRTRSSGFATKIGDAPMGENDSTRVTGVMAVDRSSGLLLRLELSSSNPAYSMRRRLVRVEQPTG